MKILFDLNVLMDVACRWEAFPASYELYQRVVADPLHQGCFPACGYTTLYYVIDQMIPEARTREVLNEFRQRLVLLPFDVAAAASAHRLQISDLEDACIAASALQGNCDVIASRNAKDFSSSPVPAGSPEEILALLDKP